MCAKISVDRAFLGAKWRLSGQQSVCLIDWGCLFTASSARALRLAWPISGY